jgi:hypothetical protein
VCVRLVRRFADHDVPLDLVAAPDRLVRTDPPGDRPQGIDFGALGDRVEAMPVLRELRDARADGPDRD